MNAEQLTYAEILQRQQQHFAAAYYGLDRSPDTIRPATWFELGFPWDEPRWGHGKRRWRRRHERIRALEVAVLGIRHRRLPWELSAWEGGPMYP